MKKRALLLSGGAFKGAFQVPIIEKLLQKNTYDDIYGTSVGAINGVMAAQNDIAILKNIWKGINGTKDFLSHRCYWPFNGFYSMKPLRKKLKENLNLGRIKIPINIGVVSGTTGEYFILSSKKMSKTSELCDSVISSSCLAGIMIPETFRHQEKIHLGFDGGYRHIIPVPNQDYETLDIISCNPIQETKLTTKFNNYNLISLIIRSIEIFEKGLYEKNLETLKKTNCLNINLYAPKKDLGGSFDARHETIINRYIAGEQAYLTPMTFKSI